MMDIERYSYLWISEKDDWVIVDSEHGRGIINKKDKMMLLVEDDALAKALADRMIREGCSIYKSINDAYADV